MNIDEFVDLARRRRNIREFKPDPVSDDCIKKMIEAARWAQSGGNGQPWEFIVVKDKDTRDKIADIYAEHRQKGWAMEKTRIREVRHLRFADGPPLKPPSLKTAPVLIVVCGDPRTVQASALLTNFLHHEGGPNAFFYKGMANATQILNLAAAACGLGSEWVSISLMSEPRLKALLDIPEEIAIHTIVAVGYPAYKPPPPYRRELNEIMHFEKYDRSKYRTDEDIYQFLLTLRQKSKAAYVRG